MRAGGGNQQLFSICATSPGITINALRRFMAFNTRRMVNQNNRELKTSKVRRPDMHIKIIRISLLAAALFAARGFLHSGVVWSANPEKKLDRIVFEEQRIEGKIRRPQLVLIRAEERPTFTPMVMQSLSDTASIVEFVCEPVIESSPYDKAFEFSGTRVSGYKP